MKGLEIFMIKGVPVNSVSSINKGNKEITVRDMIDMFGVNKRIEILDEKGFVLIDTFPSLLLSAGVNGEPHRLLDCHVTHISAGILTNKLFISDPPEIGK